MTWISAGWYLTVPTPRPSWQGPDGGPADPGLVPERVVTLSTCLAPLCPDVWAYAWTKEPSEARAREQARFGLSEEAAGALTTWCDGAFQRGELGYPCVLLSRIVALDLWRRFLRSSGALLLELALPSEDLPDLLAAIAPVAGSAEGGLAAALRRQQEAEDGLTLGFDVLGLDYGSFHSYLCNGLEREFAARFGARPNALGLFDDHRLARQCAAWAGGPEAKAEPGPWRAWRVVQHELG